MRVGAGKLARARTLRFRRRGTKTVRLKLTARGRRTLGHVCLQPWPNDYFTVADASTPTGRRLDLQRSAMPRNIAGTPVEPVDYDRSDGFSPGSPIHTKIPGLDNQAACDRTGLVPETDMARSFDPGQPAVVIDAETGERQLIGPSSTPAPPRTPTATCSSARAGTSPRATATSSPCATSSGPTARRASRRAP